MDPAVFCAVTTFKKHTAFVLLPLSKRKKGYNKLQKEKKSWNTQKQAELKVKYEIFKGISQISDPRV